MRVVLLGTAADGGFPRWNCACALCEAARDGKLPSRTQECAAVTGNSRDWWLLNASPDLRTQLTTTSALWPGSRDTPVRGVLLTDAEAEHTAGLAVLRGAAGLKVYAPTPALALLAPARAGLDRYAPWEWADALTEGGFVLAGGLVVTAYPLRARAPRYAPARAADARWVTAYRIEHLATGGVLVYAPRVAAWSPDLDALIASSDCAVLDGACSTAEGPLPATGLDCGPADFPRHPEPRRIYTRLGDTDPLLDPASAACARAAEAGVEVLLDGAEFVL